MLGLEPFFGEVIRQFGTHGYVAEGLGFALKIAAFQTDDSVGHGIALFIGDVFAHNLHQVGQWHHGTAHHKVVFALLVLAAQVLGLAVGQADGMAYLLGHANLLARPVNQFELAFGKHDGQGNAGETTACAEVKHMGLGPELDEAGNAQRVEYMVLIQVVNILAGDDIDFLVPFMIQRIKGSKLLVLFVGKCGEILLYQFHAAKIENNYELSMVRLNKFAFHSLIRTFDLSVLGRLHLGKIQKHLVFRSVCTTFAPDF